MMRQSEQSRFHLVRATELIKINQIILWGLPLVFCLHLIDELFLNGGFVYGIQRHIWPAYDDVRFGLVNAAFFILICLGSYLYFIRPDKWITLPFFWLWERTWNGVWHVLWSLIWKEYSPGLVTSFLFGLILLWVLLQEPVLERLSLRTKTFIVATAFGFELLLISSLSILR